MTTPSSPPAAPAKPATAPSAPLLARWQAWLRSALFRETRAGPIETRKILAAVAFIVCGAALSLARTRGPGALNTVWIEDANNFLNDALHRPVLDTLFIQVNGYYYLVPRLATAVAVVFPLSWVPGVMAIFASAQYAMFGLIAYVASGPHLESRWLRALVALPACVVPIGYTQVNNDLATVQFIALYGTFWLLLWVPATKGGKLTSAITMLGVTFTSILPIVFAPLALARLFAVRGKHTIALVGCYFLGLAVQYSVSLRGLSNRPSGWYTSPLWVLGKYVTRAVPRAFFGERALGGPGTNADGNPVPLHIPNMTAHDLLIVAAWLIIVAVVAAALLRVTRPHWPLAIVAGGFSVIVMLGEIVDNLQVVQPRYVIAPALLLYTMVVALLRPRPADQRRGWPGMAAYPVLAFSVVLAVACVMNYRVTNGRSESPPWTSVVATAHSDCQRPGVTRYVYQHSWWVVDIPCGWVR